MRLTRKNKTPVGEISDLDIAWICSHDFEKMIEPIKYAHKLICDLEKPNNIKPLLVEKFGIAKDRATRCVALAIAIHRVAFFDSLLSESAFVMSKMAQCIENLIHDNKNIEALMILDAYHNNKGILFAKRNYSDRKDNPLYDDFNKITKMATLIREYKKKNGEELVDIIKKGKLEGLGKSLLIKMNAVSHDFNNRNDPELF